MIQKVGQSVLLLMKQKVGHGLYSHKINLTKKQKKKYTVFIIAVSYTHLTLPTMPDV